MTTKTNNQSDVLDQASKLVAGFGQSPIEEKVLASLMHNAHSLGLNISWGKGTRPLPMGFFAFVDVQARVGPYTADMVCGIFGKDTWHVFAVECDGYMFHGKKPEQFVKDRKRDRYFATHNMPVLRFSGREILDSSDAVAKEVLQHMLDLAGNDTPARDVNLTIQARVGLNDAL